MRGLIAGFLAALLALASFGAAQEPQPAASPTLGTLETSGPADDWPVPQRVQPRGLLTAKVGHGCLATLPDEIERVALADEAIARVQIISPRELLLTALDAGETTVHVWLADGRRLRYLFRGVRDLDLLRRALKDLDPAIHAESSTDGSAIVLRGTVADRETAREAGARASAVVSAAGQGAQVLNLLRYPGAAFSVEDELQSLLSDIDSRIRVRRIQVGATPDANADTFVLEGNVRTMEQMVRAVTLAERQLGGTGGRVRAADEDGRLDADRFRRGSFAIGGLGGGTGAGQVALGAADPRSSSLAAQVARGQVITSESGRVISLLEIDQLHQVMVSIRVMEVDRVKARKAGFNFRIDAEHVSIGSYTGPNVDALPGAGSVPTVDGLGAELGNIVGAFVDQTQAIVTAIDFLQEKNVARSVAEPNVLTLSGELASISVGGEVPIPTTAATSVSTFRGFFFQNFGVRLDIRPTVTGDDMVALEVAPSISRPTSSGVDGVPTFTVQSVTSTARVQAGQSLLIGGLLAFDEGLEERGLPGLGKIPLFRWKRRSRSERELLFLITPRIVRLERQQRADAVVDPTPELDELLLPPADWPAGRDRWRDAFEPRQLPADGVPSSFRIDPETVSLAPAPEIPAAPTPEPATGPPPVVPAPEPPPTEPPPTEPTEPPPTAAATAVAGVVAERASPCLNLRPEPGVWKAPKDCLEAGTRLEVSRQDGAWSRVSVPGDGRSGWVATSYLDLGPDEPAPPTDEPQAGAAEADELERRAIEEEVEQERLEQQLEDLEVALEEARDPAAVSPPGY